MSIAALRQKLTFDEGRRIHHHVTIAKGCRDAAKLSPEHAAELRWKMRHHAHLALGKPPPAR